jgi:hypothetical protein
MTRMTRKAKYNFLERQRNTTMSIRFGFLASGLLLLAAAPASAQITGGVMWVSNSHMA